MKQINIEELQRKWSEGGKIGGSKKGQQKRRSSEHYKQAGIKSGEARRAKREAVRNISVST